MQLYVTYTSPYARLARILVLEKGLEHRVSIIEAKTRSVGSPYYDINPSGRVPTSSTTAAAAWKTARSSAPILTHWMESRASIHRPVTRIGPIADGRRQRAVSSTASRSGCAKCIGRRRSVRRRCLPTRLPAASASPTCSSRAWPSRFCWVRRGMPHLILAAALDVARKRGPGDLTTGRPRLAQWLSQISERPSLRATALP